FRALADLPSPYGEASVEILHQLEEGQTLSSSLKRHPDLFPAAYVAMVRAGEVGTTLDICIDRFGKLLQLDWRVACASGNTGENASIMFGPRPASELADMPRKEHLATLILFCEMFSTLLMSGVPILATLRLLATVMPGASGKAAIDDAIAAVGSGEPLMSA